MIMMTDAEVPEKAEEFIRSLDKLAEKMATQQEWRVSEEAVYHVVENMFFDFLEENGVI